MEDLLIEVSLVAAGALPGVAVMFWLCHRFFGPRLEGPYRWAKRGAAFTGAWAITTVAHMQYPWLQFFDPARPYLPLLVATLGCFIALHILELSLRPETATPDEGG